MKCENLGLWRQYAAAISANLGAFCIGTMVGWTSPVQPLLESATPPVGDTPMTREAVSWVGSVNFLGAILGTFFWGRISDRFGRKTTGLLIGVPFALGWFIILFAHEQYLLYIGRIIIGLGCSGVMINNPMFVTEIAQDNVRGRLGSFLMISVNAGCLFCYIVGSVASFHILTATCLAFPLIYVFSFVWMKESPAYLVSKSKNEEALNALQWYRGGDPVQAEKELTSFIGRNIKTNIGYLSLFDSKGRTKAMLISIGFILGQQLCGILAILTYTVTIFKESGSSIAPHVAAIIVGTLQVVSSFSSFVLIDKTGRKVLLGISYTVMGLSLLILGSYFTFSLQYAWIPVMSLSLHVVAYSIGAGPIPFIIMAEIFPPRIRGLAMSVIQLFGTSLSFAGVKLFANLIALLGQGRCFIFFGTCCIGLLFFTIFGVLETKGRSLQSILNQLNGDKKDEVLETVNRKMINIMPVKQQV